MSTVAKFGGASQREKEEAEREAKAKAEEAAKKQAEETKARLLKEKQEREAKAKAEAEAKVKAEAEKAKATAEPAVPAAQQHILKLLQSGAFVRQPTWKERRRLRYMESVANDFRKAIVAALPDTTDGTTAKALLDSVAHIELVARLELLKEPSDG